MRVLEKTSKNDLFYFDNYGILKFDLGGKIILLFTLEILAMWVVFMILGRWNYFLEDDYGKAILGLNIFFLTSTFTAIVFKGLYLSVYMTEVIKQIGNILFFVMIFLIIFYYTPGEIDQRISSEKPNDNLYFYTNPVILTYIFILFYMISFYVIYNSLR